MLTVPLQINGKDVFTDKTFDVVNPSTGKVIHNSASASLKEVELAVEVRIPFPTSGQYETRQMQSPLILILTFPYPIIPTPSLPISPGKQS